MEALKGNKELAQEYMASTKGNPDWHEVNEVLPDKEDLMKYKFAVSRVEKVKQSAEDTKKRKLSAVLDGKTPRDIVDDLVGKQLHLQVLALGASRKLLRQRRRKL